VFDLKLGIKIATKGIEVVKKIIAMVVGNSFHKNLKLSLSSVVTQDVIKIKILMHTVPFMDKGIHQPMFGSKLKNSLLQL
jgi:hypothetical protein